MSCRLQLTKTCAAWRRVTVLTPILRSGYRTPQLRAGRPCRVGALATGGCGRCLCELFRISAFRPLTCFQPVGSVHGCGHRWSWGGGGGRDTVWLRAGWRGLPSPQVLQRCLNTAPFNAAYVLGLKTQGETERAWSGRARGPRRAELGAACGHTRLSPARASLPGPAAHGCRVPPRSSRAGQSRRRGGARTHRGAGPRRRLPARRPPAGGRGALPAPVGCARGGPAPSCGRVPERRGALRAGPGGSAGLLRREPGRAAAGRGLPEPRGSPPAAGEGCPDPAPGGVRLCPVSRAGNRGELSGSSCFLAVREVGVGMGFLNIVIKSGNYRDWYRSVNEAAFRACGRSDHLAAIPRLAGGSSSSRPCPALLCLAARCGRATGNATAAGYAAAPRPAGRLLGSSLLGLRARGVASSRAACDRKAALLLSSPHGSLMLPQVPDGGPLLGPPGPCPFPLSASAPRVSSWRLHRLWGGSWRVWGFAYARGALGFAERGLEHAFLCTLLEETALHPCWKRNIHLLRRVSIRPFEHHLALGSGFLRSSRSPQPSATLSPEGGAPLWLRQLGSRSFGQASCKRDSWEAQQL